MTKYIHELDEDAGLRLITEQFIRNSSNFPDRVAGHIHNFINTNGHNLNCIIMMSIINALCKEQE